MGKNQRKEVQSSSLKWYPKTIQKGNVAEVARKYVINPNQLIRVEEVILKRALRFLKSCLARQ